LSIEAVVDVGGNNGVSADAVNANDRGSSLETPNIFSLAGDLNFQSPPNYKKNRQMANK
jgi:hypothetical protein